MKPRRFDAFPFAGTPTELLLLECRLTELTDVVDRFIIVEATTDHMGKSKPLNYLENECRFKPWADQITYVVADDLPTVEDNDWFWAREHAQREHIGEGLDAVGAESNDILLQSDLDEIPKPIAVRNVNPGPITSVVSFQQRGHFWAVDWLHPAPWQGTTACRVGHLASMARESVSPFAAMRDARNMTRPTTIPNAGWHFSWLGGNWDAWNTKHDMFCHNGQVRDFHKNAEMYYREGVHPTDNVKMIPVDVDESWPVWMQNPENVPDGWRRPR
jgi:beta-1,4-mannosyl-glycoprotein beta-1,4-N-acetylglucosaminyltransferase